MGPQKTLAEVDAEIAVDRQEKKAKAQEAEGDAQHRLLRNFSTALNGAIVFQEGKGDSAKYLLFYPDFNSRNGSMIKRNRVFKQFEDLHAQPVDDETLKLQPSPIQSLQLPSIGFEKTSFTMNRTKRSETELCCIRADGNFTSLLEKMKRFGIGNSAQFKECDTLASPAIENEIVKYCRKYGDYTIPAHLNGVATAEALQAKSSAKNGKHKVKQRSSSPADVFKQTMHATDRNNLTFGEWLATEEPADKKETVFAEMQKKLKKGIIANPGDDKGGLSFFTSRRIPLKLFTDIVRFASGPEDPQAVNLYCKNKRVEGLHQFPLTSDQADALREQFGIPIIHKGKPVSVETIEKAISFAAAPAR